MNPNSLAARDRKPKMAEIKCEIHDYECHSAAKLKRACQNCGSTEPHFCSVSPKAFPTVEITAFATPESREAAAEEDRQQLIESQKYTVLTELRSLDARIGKEAVRKWLDEEFLSLPW